MISLRRQKAWVSIRQSCGRALPANARRSVRRRMEELCLRLIARAPAADSMPLPKPFARIYCYHIRKTAGTSLSRAFLALEGEDPGCVERRIASSFLRRTKSGRLVFCSGLTSTLESGEYFFGYSHIPAHQLRLPPNTFTLTVLRDPAARVLSYYRYLRAGDRDGVVFKVPEAERSLAAGGFSAFLELVDKRELLQQLSFFSPTLDVGEAVSQIRMCDFVMRTETYAAGLARLSDVLGLPLGQRHDRITGDTSFRPSSSELSKLRKLLEPEYELLAELGVLDII